ncbi:MAG: glycosyltransferase family 9 protein [Thermodesulfobacteriota bacterium]
MNILIIQVLRMGDALQLLPLVQGIKEVFPQSRVSILTSTLGASVFENQPGVDEMFVLRKEALVKCVRDGKRETTISALHILEQDLGPVLSVEWDWIINFGYTFSSALLSYLLQARHRSGYSVTGRRQFLAKEAWFAHFLASFVLRQYSIFNWVDVNRKMIGLPRVPAPPVTHPQPDALSRARAFLQNAGLEERKLIGLHPGASGDHKRWPLEGFARLCRELKRREECGLLIFGGPGEKELGMRLRGLVGDGIQDLTGETTLEDLKAYLSLCTLLVTNDTGPMHLAAGVGARVLGLFFSTHFAETGPYGPGHLVIHPTLPCFPCQGTGACGHRRCLESVPPDIVRDVVLNALGIQPHDRMRMDHDAEAGVRVLMSGYDPWGYLEWAPVDRSALTLLDVEKLLLKTSWLAYTENGNMPEAPVEKSYLLSRLGAFGPPGDKEALRAGVLEMIRRLQEQRAMMEKACLGSLEIQSLCLKPGGEAARIKALGQDLEKLEGEMSLVDKDSAPAFVHELLCMMRENLERKDTLGLSTATIGVYRGMMRFSDLMIKRSRDMLDLLSHGA